ncbi:hypothetical protein DRE_04679 [Drechslerella stenobrocha 248]|uniref:RNase III domain-containing protein n=1 Tax=Drechslerella stenobrocha 248 TaxID=1043628 RepID=W7IAM2_9PEZI|nr:hypothetical protein DRE_04679 [Drechslerella stenobrocha 248]
MTTTTTTILAVPPHLLLPQIIGEDLRSSALMDQTTRRPFGTRNLNHVGQFAYKLSIAAYLVVAQPGNGEIKKLQNALTTDAEIINLTTAFGLDKVMSFRREATPEYHPLVEVFYAWMGALFLEQGLDTVRDFVGALVGLNLPRVLAIVQNVGVLSDIGRGNDYENTPTVLGQMRKRKHMSGEGAVDDDFGVLDRKRDIPGSPKRRRMLGMPLDWSGNGL